MLTKNSILGSLNHRLSKFINYRFLMGELRNASDITLRLMSSQSLRQPHFKTNTSLLRDANTAPIITLL